MGVINLISEQHGHFNIKPFHLKMVPTLVSVHLEILGFPMGVPTNTGIFLRGLKLYGENRT